MVKKVFAAVVVSLAACAATAAPAAAVGDQHRPASASGNGSAHATGNTATGGVMSPKSSLVDGSLNDLCLGVPVKADVGSVVGVVPITVQDILNAPQNQQCAQNSTQHKGDGVLSHVLSGIPVLSGNGAGNN